MKKTRTFIFRIVLAVLFITGIALSLWRFMADNRKTITGQSEEYISELTTQGIKTLDNLLTENLGFIESTAYLYGKSLTSPWADVAVIRANEENSVFDTLCFIDRSGDDYTSRGVAANLADREYFLSGMKGESGIFFLPESRLTGERALGFYAPVFYEEEILGVMAGYYGEDRIRETLDYSLFGYEGESWLCEPDGTVIGSTLENSPQNYLTWLKEEKQCSQAESDRIEEALSRGASATFSYPDQGQKAIACGQRLSDVPWMMIRAFPPSAMKMLMDNAGRSGTRLITFLVILFLVIGTLTGVSLLMELIENRKTIDRTQRDPLTDLYTPQYFYHYVKQYDQHHKHAPMDAVLLDADHFQMINERYGRSRGDEVLKRIAGRLLEEILKTDGVLCRQGADVFMMYCPHREDYSALLEQASVRIDESGEDDTRVRIRMGIYSDVDKSVEPMRRFDMAKTAADTIRGVYHTQIAYYDETILRKELYNDRLISDFSEAIRTGQFQVYLQPKYDVRGTAPVMSGAEALVRWEHPELGLLKPYVFIPLFEGNGLIGQLDTYVWRHTAQLLQTWKERYGKILPVSVNISRVDMYNPDLPALLTGLIREYGLTTDDILLEITESAYMDDSVRMIRTVQQLREAGFRIEMDDFGTGYSSLNMINDMPIDVLKIDMAFVRAAFRNGKDTRMLGIIIDIARYLSVPVIAEGVETQEQMETLRQLGCDYIQGYYFSRPVPGEEFEKYLRERSVKKEDGPEAAEGTAAEDTAQNGPEAG